MHKFFAAISFSLVALAFSTPSALAQDNSTPQSSLTWEEEQSLNGPTGLVETSRGSFAVVRFGTMQKPHHLSFNGVQPKDIASVEFLDQCCDARLTLRTGKSKVINQGQILHRTGPSSWHGYGLNSGMPLVVRDPITGKLKEERFENLEDIRRITFDPPARWVHQPATVLKESTPSIASPPSQIKAQAHRASLPVVAGDFSMNYSFSVEKLYSASMEQYLAKLKEAQKLSGFPRLGESSDPSMLNFQFLDENWTQAPLISWAKLENSIRLQVVDFWVKQKMPKISAEEHKSRALGMYQCMNVSAKNMQMMRDTGAIRIPTEGNRVDDGLSFCGISTLDNPAH